MVIKLLDRRILHDWRHELVQSARWLLYTARLVLKPRLIGGDLACLRWTKAAEVLLALPSLPRKFMIVTHAHKRPTGARILNIDIMQIGAVDRSVIRHIRWYVKIFDLLAGGVTEDVPDATIIHSLRPIFRIPDDFVKIIPQVHDEVEALIGRRLLIFKYHATIGVLRPVIAVLAADEGEAHGSCIVRRRGGQGAAETAAFAIGIDKTVPIFLRGFQSADQHPARPI